MLPRKPAQAGAAAPYRDRLAIGCANGRRAPQRDRHHDGSRSVPRRTRSRSRATRIIAVGAEAEVLAAAAADATIVDLGGRVLLPGFNDAHCHRIGDREVTGYESAAAAIQDALAGGWTSISELFVDQERLDELRRLDDAGQLPLRVSCYLPANYLEQKFGVWFGDYEPRQVFSPRLRIGGVKLFADRAKPAKMLLTEAHTDAPGYLGDVYWTADEFTDLVRTLHDDGWQLATHTCGDAAHDMVLNAYETALAGADNDAHRHRIEHVLMVRDDQVRRMRDLSIIASIQLPFMSSDWASEEEATLGPDRLAWVGRWRDLLEAGVPAVGSTDFPWAIRDELNGRSGAAMKALSDARDTRWHRGWSATGMAGRSGALCRAGTRSHHQGRSLCDVRGGPKGNRDGRQARRPGRAERRPADRARPPTSRL